MKKLFSLLAVSLFVLVSCEPDPILTLSVDQLEFSASEGSQSVYVTSNNPWNVVVTELGAFYTVSPMGGDESGYITVKVNANESGQNRTAQVAVVSNSKKSSMTRIFTINQSCPAGNIYTESVEYIPPREDKKFSAEGGTVVYVITTNAPWTMSCSESDVKLDLTAGPAGTHTITATVPPCPVFEGRKIEMTMECMTSAGGVKDILGFNQAGGLVIYGGETYHAVQMKDGKWWMKENLRYVPDGMTPSADLSNVTAGVFYPVVMNSDNTGLAFSTDAAVIKSKGYLYQAEVALGKKVGDLTSVEAAEALNGTQGICPKGWHVPTSDDIINLVGKAVSPLATKTDAPYYDGNNGSIVLLNEDGFNMDAFGAISIQDNTKTSGSFMGWAKAYPEKISSGMLCGSTYAGVTYNTKDDPTSGVKNLQFFGFMPMTNKATEAEYTCNGTKVSYRIAAPLRCVKNN